MKRDRFTPTHGLSRTAEYRTWGHMLDRCVNPNCVEYPKYGGRGIEVCDRWLLFVNFIADMGQRPSDRHSLDRIDNNSGYSPRNCRWTTMMVQSRNRRNNVVLEWDGRSQCLMDWALELGVCYNTLNERLRRGWTADATLATPIRPRRTSRWLSPRRKLKPLSAFL